MKEKNIRSYSHFLAGIVVSAILLFVLAICIPGFAVAAGDAANDAKLQAMKSDLMAYMQTGAAGQAAKVAFSKKYNVSLSKLNEKVLDRPPASDGGWDVQTADIVCGLEMYTGIGWAVWESRSTTDNCKKHSGRAESYCIAYSTYCDHYAWTTGYLKEKCPDCCN